MWRALVLAAALTLAACALHNPVPVDPDYPPPVPFAGSHDAGADAR